MNGNFTFHNPTKLHFGEKAMEALAGELKNYGPVVQLSYGGGSIKKNGIYDQVVAALESAGKTVVEDGGVMSNPTLERMLEGAAKAKANNVDLIRRSAFPRGARRIRGRSTTYASRSLRAASSPWGASSRWSAPAAR